MAIPQFTIGAVLEDKQRRGPIGFDAAKSVLSDLLNQFEDPGWLLTVLSRHADVFEVAQALRDKLAEYN